MPDYNVANLVTETKIDMINDMPCGCGTRKINTVRE
jgi:hypothetical protein